MNLLRTFHITPTVAITETRHSETLILKVDGAESFLTRDQFNAMADLRYAISWTEPKEADHAEI